MKISKTSFALLLGMLVLVIALTRLVNNNNWSFYVENKIGSKSYSSNNLFFDTTRLYFSDQEEKIYSLNKETGRIDWVFDKHKNSPFSMNILDNIYIANFDSHVYSLNKQNGYINWSFVIPNSILPDTQPVTDKNDKFVFFADRAGILYALDKKTGNVIWTKQYTPLDNQHEFIPNSIHFGYIKQDDNNLFIENSPENKFEILDKNTGKVLYSLQYKFNSEDLIVLKNIILIPKSKNEYVAISRNGFNEKWSIGESLGVRFNVHTFLNDDISLLIEDGLNLSKIKSDDKSVLWQYSYQSTFNVKAVDVINNQIIIEKPNINRFNSQIEVLDSFTGKVKWTSEISSQISSVNFYDNRIFVNTLSNKTIIFDATSGKQLKEVGTQDLTVNISSFDNYFVIVTKDQRKKPVIYCLDKSNLDLLWTYKSDTTIDPSEIYIDGDRLYFIDDSKKIIQSLKIGESLQKITARRNFDFVENFGIVKPGLDYKTNENFYESALEYLRRIIKRYVYIVRNITSVFRFDVSNALDKNNLFHIQIKHNQNLYNNYFTDIKIEVLFIDSQNKSYLVNGYYYDFDTWMVNFTPPHGGNWKWRSVITTPYTAGLHSGGFVVEGGFKKQTLTIEGKDMVIDNTVFFPIGIQDSINDKNYNGNILDQMGYAGKLSPTTNTQDNSYISFDDYIKLYKEEAGLNFYRVNIDNFGPSILKDLDLDNFDININDAKAVDHMIESLKGKNYKIIMSLFGFYPPFQDSEKTLNKQKQREVESYLDYMIARYAPYVDIWEISNEATIPIDWQNYISDYILKKDIYKHPITISWDQKNLKNSDLLSIHWYSEIKGINNLEDQINRILSSNSDWSKAILISEFGLKDFSYFQDSHNYMRVFTWLGIFNRVGIVYWNEALGIFQNPNNANIYVGPIERKYLKNLQQFLPTMSPPLETNRVFSDKLGVNLYLLKSKRFTLGYLLNQKTYCQKDIDIDTGVAKSGVLEWFDPANGIVLATLELTNAQQVIKIPNICLDLAFKITYP